MANYMLPASWTVSNGALGKAPCEFSGVCCANGTLHLGPRALSRLASLRVLKTWQVFSCVLARWMVDKWVLQFAMLEIASSPKRRVRIDVAILVTVVAFGSLGSPNVILSLLLVFLEWL